MPNRLLVSKNNRDKTIFILIFNFWIHSESNSIFFTNIVVKYSWLFVIFVFTRLNSIGFLNGIVTRLLVLFSMFINMGLFLLIIELDGLVEFEIKAFWWLVFRFLLKFSSLAFVPLSKWLLVSCRVALLLMLCLDFSLRIFWWFVYEPESKEACLSNEADELRANIS